MKFHLAASLLSIAAVASAQAPGGTPVTVADRTIGAATVATIPFDPARRISSATYTPGGRVLVAYHEAGDDGRLNLALVDDDGTNMRPFFSQAIPKREKDNGLRFMMFADDRRIFLGDFIVECAAPLDTCKNPALLPVDYPAEVAGGPHIAHRWSEMVVAPDNRHVAWTTLLADYAAIVFVGELERTATGYRIVRPRIVSTLDPFGKDPKHPDGVLPAPIRGGEVKQFVHGGTALSLVGAVRRDTPDSVVQNLATGAREGITDVAGYTETTIFSPDERLGLTMTTRFSARTDPAILGLMPRPYPDSLNMGLSMFAYTYAVTGVRRGREGNVGPALIDIAASKRGGDYRGTDLAAQDGWVYHSPMSWHPGGRKAMWIEGRRGTDEMRMRVVRLAGYTPAAPVPPRPFPREMAGSIADMSVVKAYAVSGRNIDVKVYGRATGSICYRRTPDGAIEKLYDNFSDDGRLTYSGSERMAADPRARSTYTARVRVSGAKTGMMDLKITFGPLGGDTPAAILFTSDATGTPLSHGYAEYDGRRLNVDSLAP